VEVPEMRQSQDAEAEVTCDCERISARQFWPASKTGTPGVIESPARSYPFRGPSCARPAAQTLDANLPIFFTAFLLAMGATVISWLTMRWPRREAPEPYGVVRRFRFG